MKGMKILNASESINNNYGRIQQIVEFEGKKFKLISELRNGGNSLSAELMDSEGIFRFVLGNNDVGYDFDGESYVSTQSRKDASLNTGLDKLKAVIRKVY